MAEADLNDAADFSPEALEEGTGVALTGDGLPVNHRLRAERLAAMGATTDDAGLIDDDLIANTSDRLAAEQAVADAVPTLDRMTKAELATVADGEGVDLSSASTKAEMVVLIEAARNSNPEGTA